jgi:uncharacterized membrane protein
MAFCASCGAQVEGKFCAKCGATVEAPAGTPPGTGAPPPSSYVAPPAATAGMTDNVASLLCYLVGFVTGILFLVIEPYNKNRAIRFHAFQSIFLNVAWVAVLIALSILTSILLAVSFSMFALIGLLHMVINLSFLALWIYMMVAAYQGKQVELPVIGALAKKQAGA